MFVDALGYRKGKDTELKLPPGVELRVSATARRVSLRVDPTEGHVVVTLPPRGGAKTAMELLRDNAGWVALRLPEVPAAAPFADGATVLDAYRALIDSGRTGQVKSLFLADAAKEAQTLLAKGVEDRPATLDRFGLATDEELQLALLGEIAPTDGGRVHQVDAALGKFASQGDRRHRVSGPQVQDDAAARHPLRHALPPEDDFAQLLFGREYGDNDV